MSIIASVGSLRSPDLNMPLKCRHIKLP